MCFRNSPEFRCLAVYVDADKTECSNERLVPGCDGFYDLVSDEHMTSTPTDWPIEDGSGTEMEITVLLPADDGEGGFAWSVVDGRRIPADATRALVVIPLAG